MKKIIIFVLLILLTALSALNTYATEIPDLSRTASVSVEMTYMGSPVGGGTLTAYRVAEIKIENGADYGFAFLEEYADCEADISDFGDVNLASEFASFIKENNISGTTLAIDEKGNVGFNDLELGLYVFVQNDPAEGYTKVGAFMVSVPQNNGDGYVYDVDATPKISTRLETVDSDTEAPPVTTTPPTSTPTPGGELPQTGMLKWPIPILLVSGAMFVILGMYFLAERNKKYGKN
ncbi:MAG: hypothetical protein IJC50_07105 [Clostridia bacterium]|nr:hypothetical protein [Clostridia bacterium]